MFQFLLLDFVAYIAAVLAFEFGNLRRSMNLVRT